MKKNKNLISLSGREGSGKDTVVQMIQNTIDNAGVKPYQIKSFSELIKDRMELTFPHLFKKSQWEKSSTDRDYRNEFIKELGMTRREWIIKEGMGAREIHKDYWAKALFNTYNSGKKWIIKDTRFLNEGQEIDNEGGIKVLLMKNYDNKIDKESETEMYLMNFDYIIDNRRTTLSELQELVNTFVYEYSLV